MLTHCVFSLQVCRDKNQRTTTPPYEWDRCSSYTVYGLSALMRTTTHRPPSAKNHHVSLGWTMGSWVHDNECWSPRRLIENERHHWKFPPCSWRKQMTCFLLLLLLLLRRPFVGHVVCGDRLKNAGPPWDEASFSSSPYSAQNKRFPSSCFIITIWTVSIGSIINECTHK